MRGCFMFRSFGLKGFLANALNELRTELHSISTIVQGSSANQSVMLNTQINILKEFQKMSAALDRLTQEVADVKTVNQSAITLLQGLAQQIRDSADDSDALNALADSLDADSKGLADAVTANTPATPAPPADTTPPPAA